MKTNSNATICSLIVMTMMSVTLLLTNPSVYGGGSNDAVKGALTSLQNNENNTPTWIVSGVFRMDNLNTTSPTLNATFYMIKTDGTASHTHTISDFKLIGDPVVNGNTTMFNGTSTITMKNGPVNDVPISIRLMDDSAVSIWVDPSKTDKHFGNTVIYGTQHLICVEKAEYCK